MPTFSTIIPAYNRGTLIRETLESVFAQTMAAENEIIVVDDGSTDDTPQVLANYSDQIRVIRITNSGPSAARNAGIAEANGGYICFLDSDDLWLPHALDTYLRIIKRCDEPTIIVAAIEPFSGGLLSPSNSPEDEVRRFNDYFEAAGQPMWHGCSAIVCRTHALRTVGGFSGSHMNAEDSDLLMKLGTANGFVQILSPITGGYRTHDGSAVADVERTLTGMTHMIDQEKRGNYPGGTTRKRQRQILLTRHLRPAILGALRSGRRAAAWRLYFDSFRWNLAERRMKFLAGFFLKALSR